MAPRMPLRFPRALIPVWALISFVYVKDWILIQSSSLSLNIDSKNISKNVQNEHQSVFYVSESKTNSRSEVDYSTWLRTFKAKNSLYQDFCLTALHQNKSSSQYSQDLWLFHNIFKSYALQNKIGYYVDSGANDWKELSNTFFYDVCLGWEGLCIEPAEMYHAGLKKHRSCTLISKCISSEAKSMGFTASGAGSRIDKSGKPIQCDTLASMLDGRTRIDLWSLDVEAHEIQVLKAIDFSKVKVLVLLIEDFHISKFALDQLLLSGISGLFKMIDLIIDAVYVHQDLIKRMQNPQHYWFPLHWPSFMDQITRYKASIGKPEC